MNIMRRFIFPLALSLCLLFVVSHHTTVAAKDTWVSVRTKNFFLLGNAGEKDIRQVGLKLEQFREVFTRLFPQMKFNTSVPTTVVVFKSDRAYAPFKPDPNTAGYFQAGPDVNYITLTTEVRGEQDPYSVIFHEYTHLLMENTFESVPVWFNEGLAEYYSTLSVSEDQKVLIGKPIGNHVFLLRDNKMLPLRTLFEVDYKSPHYHEKNKQGIFYAQSWALTHYLIMGKVGRGEQLNKFVKLLIAKLPTEQAFQQAFGVPFETIEKDLRAYVKQDRYNMSAQPLERKVGVDTETQVAQLTEAEAQAYLGDLLLHSNRKEAYTYLEKALKLDPNLGMAHASLGMAYFREGKVNEARASLERAVAANSQNYLAHYYYALMLSRSGPNDAPSVSEYTPEVVAKMRDHLQKAIALRPDFAGSYNLLGFLSVVTGQNLDESIAALKRVLSSSPGRHELAYTLGQLYARKGEYKTARDLLEQVTKSKADDEVRQHAEELLKQIRTYEEQTAQYEAAKKRAAASAIGPSVVYSADTTKTSPEPTDPSSYLREALRSPKAGETQLQAKLVKIECDPKGIVFVVQTATGLLRLKTASFDEIELTTYDPTIKGEISCGPRKPENVVIVCYLPNTDKRVKMHGILKSIEFVPSDFKLKPTP
jgi:tetratricopeptide (TPR) repeat protein